MRLKVVVLLLASAILAFGECPVGNISVGTVILNGQTMRDGGLNWGVSIKYTNSTAKTIVGAKFRAVWLDVTYDPNTTFTVWTADSKVKPGAERREKWQQPPEAIRNKGWVVAPYKIAYSDGSIWQIGASDGLCFGQTTFGEGTPLKAAPALLLR